MPVLALRFQLAVFVSVHDGVERLRFDIGEVQGAVCILVNLADDGSEITTKIEN